MLESLNAEDVASLSEEVKALMEDGKFWKLAKHESRCDAVSVCVGVCVCGV